MDKESRRLHILECAKREFADKGYFGTGVADIIARAGIARGTFYLYFESKRAVFDELLGLTVEAIAAAVRPIEFGPGAPVGVWVQLEANLRRVVDFLLADEPMTKLLFSEAVGLDDEAEKTLATFYNRLIDLVEGSLVQGREMGIIRPLNTRVMAFCILGAMKEVLYQNVMRSEGLDRDTIVRQVLAFCLDGVLTPEFRAAQAVGVEPRGEKDGST